MSADKQLSEPYSFDRYFLGLYLEMKTHNSSTSCYFGIRTVRKGQFETVCFTNGKSENVVVRKCTGSKMYVSKIQNNI